MANLVPRDRDPFGLRQGSRRMVSADQNARGLCMGTRLPTGLKQ